MIPKYTLDSFPEKGGQKGVPRVRLCLPKMTGLGFKLPKPLHEILKQRTKSNKIGFKVTQFRDKAHASSLDMYDGSYLRRHKLSHSKLIDFSEINENGRIMVPERIVRDEGLYILLLTLSRSKEYIIIR